MLSYKKNSKDVISRLTDLYTGNGRDRIFASMSIPNPVLAEYRINNSAGVVSYPDPRGRIEFWDSCLSHSADLEDDSIPSVYLSEFDQGLYGGLLGGPVCFLNDPDTGRVTSMTEAFWDDLSQVASLALPGPGQLWYDRMMNQFEVYAQACKGKFLCSHFICVASMNLMFELRGATNSFVDMLDDFETMRQVLDFSIGLNTLVQDAFFETTGLYEGGTASNMVQWAPGRIISESVDPFHLTRPDVFDQFGREYVEKVIAPYDGAVIHLHANGYRLLPHVSDIEKVIAVRLIDDVYNPRAIDSIEKYLPQSRGVPLILQIPYGDFIDLLNNGKLPGNVFYRVGGVPSLDEANRAMEKVRSYRCI